LAVYLLKPLSVPKRLVAIETFLRDASFCLAMHSSQTQEPPALAEPISQPVIKRDLMDRLCAFCSLRLPGQALPGLGVCKAVVAQMLRTSSGEFARLHRQSQIMLSFVFGPLSWE
jgi:hypothetical protein